jgi:diacylglycerol O-acyltransferase/trehalose O-mycolyltransferase
MRWLRVVSLVLAGAVLVGGCAALSEPTAAAPSKAVRVVSVNKVDDRTRDVVIDSPSVGEVRVRLLVPVGFEADPNRRWPVLYLLHGANDPDTYQCWTRSTDVAALTAGLPLLVVMPEGGTEGYYSDWFNKGRSGPPAWETFHLVELLQVLDRDWRASDHRAVAGLSMGGLGAMLYAPHSPHLFRAAASFSGVLDTLGTSGWQFPPDVWGDRTQQAGIWRQHNPIDRAADLRGISLFVSYGNGDPGPLDVVGNPSGVGDQSERQLAQGNAAFVRRLGELGIPAEVNAYGPGTHNWPYWQRELHRALPGIMRALQT